MSGEHRVSRRASLRSLGAASAAVVLGGVSPTAQQPAANSVAGGPGASLPNVVDLAVARFGKGHS
jgi:hypothetical protein